MANGFTDLQVQVFEFVKSSSVPTITNLCTYCDCCEEELRPVVEDLAEIGYLRIDEGENGREDRVKPHPDRQGLLWQIKLS